MSQTPQLLVAAEDSAGRAGPLPRLARLAYGGDYNPEQWPESVWAEDVELMRVAGVNLVSVGIFAWALLEPAEGQFEFGWFDRLLDLLHDGGIGVDLATPTAVPPAWFRRRHPQARLVDRHGLALGGGARQSFCPSSPAYAEASARITEQLARRYADHPALVLWHSHNEYGGANALCYCATSAEAFRDWLRDRYGDDLDRLNTAWGTTFWGQRYADWAEIEPPSHAPTSVNPTQQLDFLRFSSDAHLGNFRRERDILHRLSPGVPVTTNFMIANCKTIDYWRWAAEVDVVSNDHYLRAEEPDNHIELAMCADLTRAVAGGRPWLLMEHATSAVNWQPRNIAKRPGELRRNSLSHLARGAESALFFQWRASRFGAEKFHSAMLPHGGTDTRIWREVVALGADLPSLEPLRGTRVVADVAVLWDWESWWAVELDWRPSVDLDYRERMAAYYERLWRDRLSVDFAHPERALDGYRLVVVPSLYLTTPAAAENLRRYVAGGGTLLVSYFSGIVDADDAIHPGGHPGALRELLGLTVEEFLPLRSGETVRLAAVDADPARAGAEVTGDVWAEVVVPQGATPVLSYLDGPAAGGPAVTRHTLGAGHAWYVSTRLTAAGLAPVLRAAYRDAGLVPPDGVPEGVELVRRAGADGSRFLIAINHTDREVELAATGTDLLDGSFQPGVCRIPAGGVRALRA
ncbi:beta-galactosidase [Plantactinospora sp. KLBMP9567]|uniref:beta-galactosidase n=1 Tax=Plantactinospora sp. KLBMP9567 TaxID=3085900 RepID=UPI0029814D24|nr:beta-galactosidase [Plantactinospora sp. KLBMP9567]MDW5323982.1 beta-galactosidase [Plantactinospora sp. KLBMP9567]